MAISANYPMPVIVNGYSCKNCTDVGYAKKNIDPQHPQAGPFGINAKNDPTLQQRPSVAFGGLLKSLNDADSKSVPTSSPLPTQFAPGSQIDLLA